MNATPPDDMRQRVYADLSDPQIINALAGGDPHAGGTWLRQWSDKPQHWCSPPEHAEQGDIWRCGCLRRWKCVDRDTNRGGMTSMTADWRRRYLPWPR